MEYPDDAGECEAIENRKGRVTKSKVRKRLPVENLRILAIDCMC